MIELHYCNNATYVFGLEDWESLRKNHRIIGELTGSTSTLPALPVRLLPEEVSLLLEKNLARVVAIEDKPPEHSLQHLGQFQQDLLAREQIVYKQRRKQQLELMLDNIVEAKRRNGDSRPRDEILEDEVNKSALVTEETMAWPTFVEPLDCVREAVASEVILGGTSVLKRAVFRDLWHRNYYLTPGTKFGGDFLVYHDDPIVCHALFIVKCVEDPLEVIHSSEIVAFGRLGSAVKKKAVLATLSGDNDKIHYITINWIDA